MFERLIPALTAFVMLSQAQAAPPLRTNANVALSDFQQGKPLEGLPDLKKPVYIKPNILVCESSGALANPNVPILLNIGACVYTEVKMRINVRVPRDAQSYMQNYMYSMIQVTWQTGELSSPGVSSGWLYLDGLTN